MSLFDYFRRTRNEPSADTAKQRLQVLLTLERATGPDFLPLLQRELLDVIRKYIEIDDDKVKVEFERDQAFSMLEVQIELPSKLAQRPI